MSTKNVQCKFDCIWQLELTSGVAGQVNSPEMREEQRRRTRNSYMNNVCGRMSHVMGMIAKQFSL
jgi:hypothetical protein